MNPVPVTTPVVAIVPVPESCVINLAVVVAEPLARVVEVIAEPRVRLVSDWIELTKYVLLLFVPCVRSRM